MEQIKVNNFLVIKDATFEISKLNIIIGPQANGKSILVKLSYFFRKLVNNIFLNTIKDSESHENLILSSKALFENYFPSYVWKNTDFSIKYSNEQFTIDIINNIDNFDLVFCDNFLKLKNDMENKYKKFLQKNKKNTNDLLFSLFSFRDFQRDYFKNNTDSNCIKNLLINAVFIPASRSYFISLQKNIFSFLSKDIDIDIFIKEFGSYYERSKEIYNQIEIFKTNSDLSVKFKMLMNSILKGEFIQKDGKDWIKIEDTLISLSDASSGQQESLPMLMVLFSQFILGNKNINYIEEPEAHLFPTSQKYIIDIIALLYNANNINFITTHSPYILTAINNLILAYDVMKKNENNPEITKIIDKNFTINFDDVSAYTIEKGILTSIKDNDTRLIGMNIIDSVSDDFSEEFDKLLQLSL